MPQCKSSVEIPRRAVCTRRGSTHLFWLALAVLIPWADLRAQQDSPEHYLPLLTNQSAFVRQHAIAALGRLGSRAAPAVPDLRRAYDSEPDVTNKIQIVCTLEAMGTNATLMLLSLLDETNAALRRQVYMALARSAAQGPTVASELVERLRQQHDDGPLVSMVFSAMGSAAVPSLIAMLRDGEEWIRAWSGRALVHLGSASVPEMCARLEISQNPGERAVIIRLLGLIGPAAGNAVPLLQDMEERETDEIVRNILSTALRRISGGGGAGGHTHK